MCSETDLPARFVAEVERQQAQLLLRGADYGWLPDGAHWQLFGQNAQGQAQCVQGLAEVSLPKDNLVTALQAFWVAGFALSDRQIVDALTRVSVPGRMQRLTLNWRGQSRRLLLDVGHNPHAAAFLAAALGADKAPRLAVFGLLADKDLAGVVAPLAGVFDRWALAPLPSPRTRPVNDLAACLTALGERSDSYGSVAQALEQSLESSSAATEIVIFGSFFCVSAAILWINQQTRDLNNG